MKSFGPPERDSHSKGMFKITPHKRGDRGRQQGLALGEKQFFLLPSQLRKVSATLRGAFLAETTH